MKLIPVLADVMWSPWDIAAGYLLRLSPVILIVIVVVITIALIRRKRK